MRKGYLILSAFFFAASIISLALFFSPRGRHVHPETTVSPAQTFFTESNASPSEQPSAYQSPIDFKKLQEQNGDVYAWLLIPGTTISEPVVQHPEDDSYYLRRNLDESYSVGGTLFTEQTYNSRSFDDPVTIIYGHHMLDDSKFGNLQLYYSDEETFHTFDTVTVYMPDKELHYQVFAAVPYSNQHILYYYNCFQTSFELDNFIEGVYSIRGFSVNRIADYEITHGDRLLILSTCLRGNRNKRYLVLARLEETLP